MSDEPKKKLPVRAIGVVRPLAWALITGNETTLYRYDDAPEFLLGGIVAFRAIREWNHIIEKELRDRGVDVPPNNVEHHPGCGIVGMATLVSSRLVRSAEDDENGLSWYEWKIESPLRFRNFVMCPPPIHQAIELHPKILEMMREEARSTIAALREQLNRDLLHVPATKDR